MPPARATHGAYGARYRQQRQRLLADDPPCVWCGEPATTADHVPPLSSAAPGCWEGVLLPACRRCNYGHRAERAAAAVAPPATPVTGRRPDAYRPR